MLYKIETKGGRGGSLFHYVPPHGAESKQVKKQAGDQVRK